MADCERKRSINPESRSAVVVCFDAAPGGQVLPDPGEAEPDSGAPLRVFRGAASVGPRPAVHKHRDSIERDHRPGVHGDRNSADGSAAASGELNRSVRVDGRGSSQRQRCGRGLQQAVQSAGEGAVELGRRRLAAQSGRSGHDDKHGRSALYSGAARLSGRRGCCVPVLEHLAVPREQFQPADHQSTYLEFRRFVGGNIADDPGAVDDGLR